MPRWPDPDRERCVVSTAWLEENLSEPELRVFDCTVYLRPPSGAGPYDPESGRADYEEAHVPGAGFIDLIGDLSRHDTSLHFMSPAPEQFAAAMSRAGIGEASRVVLYSAGHIMWATRVWWMLRAFGFENAAVLDGGFDKWRAEGRAVSAEPGGYPPAHFEAKPQGGFFVDRDDVQRALDAPNTCIINALNPDYYRGEGKSRYGRSGRIPGSVNVPAKALLRETHDFVSLEEAARQFTEAGVNSEVRVMTYCGGGISATVDNLMLYRLGHDAVATYDASMGEWAQDDNLPIERDTEE